MMWELARYNKSKQQLLLKPCSGEHSSIVSESYSRLQRMSRRPLRFFMSERGQGTTEYAILVGVLVVIAIVAIISFRDKVSQLWSAISDGINSL